MPANRLAQTCRDLAALPSEGLPFSEFVHRIMRLLRQSVPCDTINLGTIDLETEYGFHFALDGFLMPEKRRELLPLFKHQNPMVEWARNNGISPPLRFTDFSSRRQFEETAIYRECYRGYTHSMITFGIEAPSGLNTSFVLSRGSGDFSDKEKENLEILQPLVSTIVQQQLLKESLSGTRHAASAVGVIQGCGQHVITMDETAKTLIQAFLKPLSLNRIHQDFLPSINCKHQRSMQIAELDNGLCLMSRLSSKDHTWTLHLWEENQFLPAEPLSKFGFTGRQIEVLQWMERGKTNPEIAAILDISYRTVQKHLEKIYSLLGVETRIAAINRCRELVRQTSPRV